LQTRGKEEEQEKDRQLEHITGDLMIAQYQVHKIYSKVVEKIAGYYYSYDKKSSAFAFNHNKKYYKVSIKVEEIF
jgi:hypothetical protein